MGHVLRIAFFRKIIGSQVKAGPDELGPNIVSDGARVGADQCKQALGRDHAPHRIESARDQLPLLEIAKEHAKDGDAASACAGRENLAAALHMNRIDAAPIASMPLTNDGNGFRGECPGPIGGRSDLWMHLAEPSADVEQEIVALVPVACSEYVARSNQRRLSRHHSAGTPSVSAGDSFLSLNRTLDLHRFRDSAHAGQNTRECDHAIASSARRPARDHCLEVFDLQLIEVWRALIQQGLKDGAQDERSCACSHIAPLAQASSARGLATTFMYSRPKTLRARTT